MTTGRTLIWDVETNGFLKEMTKITSLVIRDKVTRETFVFRNHNGYNRRVHDSIYNFAKPFRVLDPTVPDEWVEPEDSIMQGVQMLQDAEHLVGHNIVAFDLKAIKKCYPNFKQPAQITDTLVMTRAMRPDIKNTDYRLNAAGKLPGKLIGKHNLDSWGFRLGKHKGDYMAQMRARGLDPFKDWNQSLEDYCINDVDVTEILFAAIEGDKFKLPEKAFALEHGIHELMGVVERNGFPFDAAAARTLVEKLQSDKQALIDELKPIYGRWLAPDKKRYVDIEYDDPDGVNAKRYAMDMAEKPVLNDKGKPKVRKYYAPRTEFGEDMSRPVWGEITMYKRDYTPDDYPNSPKRVAGLPLCKAKWVEFNPESRSQIINRFQLQHNWTPAEFTEEGNPKLSHDVLDGLKDHIPAAPMVAEVFFLSKLIGYVSNGSKSWLGNVDADTGRIHGATITGGTVSGRCAHQSPNLGQIPGVKVEDGYKKDGVTINPKVIDKKTGQPYDFALNADGIVKRKVIMMGRPGRYGYECRDLFRVPEFVNGRPWQQIGVDLKGIEFRALAELVREFDGGELMDIVVSGRDPHQFNADAAGTTRDIAKRLLYALMYGAGDWKLGFTVQPLGLTRGEQTTLGKQLRAQMMEGLPALRKAIEKVKRDAERGYLIGLDGRRLGVRSSHSAFNLRLQSDAALIAKKWVCLTEEYCLNDGMDHGWEGDFAMLAFVHDEEQAGVSLEASPYYIENAHKAARDAGLFFGWKCPVEADHKTGRSWAECH